MRAILLVLAAWAMLASGGAGSPRPEGPIQVNDGGTGGPPPKP